MKRRAFITLLGGAAVSWPLAARAQQPDRVRRIGFQGRDVAIEYRWAENQYDRLPSLVAELIHQQVSVIAALTTPSAIAAKAATAIIPIVFTTIADPVQIGLVASLNRPGGNLTGVTILNVEIVPKMLELLHQVVPTATTMAALVNPTNPNADTFSTGLQVAARTLGLGLNVLRASTERDIDEAFATLIPLRVGGLVIVNDVFLITREEQLAALALRHKLPTIFQSRDSVVAGGLMSYGGSASDAYRQAGVYIGRVLKGEKPANLARSAVHENRADHQPEDGQDAWHHHPAAPVRPRRRVDRINANVLRCMSQQVAHRVDFITSVFRSLLEAKRTRPSDLAGREA